MKPDGKADYNWSFSSVALFLERYMLNFKHEQATVQTNCTTPCGKQSVLHSSHHTLNSGQEGLPLYLTGSCIEGADKSPAPCWVGHVTSCLHSDAIKSSSEGPSINFALQYCQCHTPAPEGTFGDVFMDDARGSFTYGEGKRNFPITTCNQRRSTSRTESE
jgi:hypothetical protein